MKQTSLGQRALSPRTRQQQQSRLWSIVILLLALGPLAVGCGALLSAWARAARRRRAFVWLALAGIAGFAILAWYWQTLRTEFFVLRELAQPLGRLMRPKPGAALSAQQIGQALAAIWPPIWWLWRAALLLAPMVASYIDSSRVRTAEDLERERAERLARDTQRGIQLAAARGDRAPDTVAGSLVLGVPLGGDLRWEQGDWFTYPAAILGRHLVLVGGSGTGKTETSKRLAYGAAKAYGWKVFYLDCKGDQDTAEQFLAAMRSAGRTALALFPDTAYDGWRGDATAILNRLLSVLDYTEPYYRDMTKMMLSLAIDAPPGPPRTSAELLERLNLYELEMRYAGQPEAREIAGIRREDGQAAYNRYRAFFRALGGGLDGNWAFEDVDAGYILLKGLELKDQTASLGRYMLEDFAHFVATRKGKDTRVLLIVDEFPAIAFGGANAATLFEMVRSHGAGIAVTAQSYAGMGADADRILGAAAGLIVHQCADPERLLARAGQSLAFERRISFTERGMGQLPREYAVGEGTLAATEALKVNPDRVKQLAPGDCFVIAAGCAQHVHISRVRVATPKHVDKPAGALPAIAEIDRATLRTRPVGNPMAPAAPAVVEAEPLTLGSTPETGEAEDPLPGGS